MTSEREPIVAELALNEIAGRLAAAGLFYGHGTDNPHDEAWWLLHVAINGTGVMQDIPADLVLSAAAWQRAQELLRRRIDERRPLAYLVGEAWFCGLPFTVDERVLVPRSPLAELIASGFSSLLSTAPTRVLDLCTGSGCIGLACAMAFPEAEVVLSDLSQDALAVAQLNRQRHGLEQRVSLCHSNLFESVEGCFDLIVSNPPYVSREEYEALPKEYHCEPALGLIAEDNGLAIPLAILAQAAEHLRPGGLLVMEVGDSWEALAEAVPDLPLLWLDFDQGGYGVCALRREQLLAWQAAASPAMGSK